MSRMLLPWRSCRSCGVALGDSTVIKSFDEVPVAGIYVSGEDAGPDPQGVLSLRRCRGCALVQLGEALDPSFYRQYRFVSGIASTYREYLVRLADGLASSHPGGRVLEIGASDGTLLKLLQQRGLSVAGFEPSAVAARARGQGVAVVEEYFDAETAAESPIQNADVVVIRHVLEHLHEFGPLFAGIQKVTHARSVLVVEVPDLQATVAQRIFGNVYHPHACYFDHSSLGSMLARHQWELKSTVEVPIFGGSLLAVATRDAAPPMSLQSFGIPAQAVDPGGLSSFIGAWREHLDGLREFLDIARRSGRRVAGYGAAERTGAVIGMAGITREDVSCIYDRNPAFEGLLLAGSRIPIRSPKEMADDRPEMLILFARSFEEEIVASLPDFRRKGGTFVTLRTHPPSLLAV